MRSAQPYAIRSGYPPYLCTRRRASTVFILFVLSAIAFFCTVFTGFLLVQTVRECGVRRRVSARLAADPEAELDELHDDGETQYQHDDLRIDLTRLLFDGRSVLLFIYTIFLAEEYTHQLWATLDDAFGRSHVFEQRFAFWLIPNLLYYLRGLRLPVTAVCLSSMVMRRADGREMGGDMDEAHLPSYRRIALSWLRVNPPLYIPSPPLPNDPPLSITLITSYCRLDLASLVRPSPTYRLNRY